MVTVISNGIVSIGLEGIGNKATAAAISEAAVEDVLAEVLAAVNILAGTIVFSICPSHIAAVFFLTWHVFKRFTTFGTLLPLEIKTGDKYIYYQRFYYIY
jgi:uncharacterized membrane protein